MLALIDVGFQVLERQRPRLAGIDASSLGTRKGERARELIQDELARVDFVALNTDTIDLYGRYVAHLFHVPAESNKRQVLAEGCYLNQRLVEEGLAEVL